MAINYFYTIFFLCLGLICLSVIGFKWILKQYLKIANDRRTLALQGVFSYTGSSACFNNSSIVQRMVRAIMEYFDICFGHWILFKGPAIHICTNNNSKSIILLFI